MIWPAKLLSAAAWCTGFALLGSCGTRPPVRSATCAPATASARADDGQANVIHLSVLTHNIEGLGWPARTNRALQLQQIGERLDALRRSGHGPDVILFQEMFSGAAKRAVAASGYPAIAPGPRRTAKPAPSTLPPLPGRRSLAEWGPHVVGSGLAIASRFPIVAEDRNAYGRRSCAGRDCLANKGIMLARLAIPGLPMPIDIYNTHMNSRTASRAPVERHIAAHERQSLEASEFIERTHDDAAPAIFGGDFNMRQSGQRWENFTRYQTLTLVHRVCAEPRSGCEVHMSWDGDAPWMDTQDLQFFDSGETIGVRPVRVEALFDGSPDSPKLSDHDGFMVTYELSWKGSLRSLPSALPICGSP
ncbi:metal-dependent hydrolase [Sphingomonas sp. AP4-R1]|nr:metal-dependent hydrolase [Sphingomonas sp. AP4-R1]